MIELELKYEILNVSEQIEKLELKKNKRQRDVYYDTNDYILLKNGNFLRVRNGKRLEFKLDIDDTTHLFCKETSFDLDTANQNMNNILGLLQQLGVHMNANTIDDVLNHLSTLAVIDKNRKEYHFNDECSIAIDYVEDLGTFLEAEIVINQDIITAQEAEQIKSELIDQLRKAQIISDNDTYVNTGYVELFLLKHNKKAYDMGKFKI